MKTKLIIAFILCSFIYTNAQVNFIKDNLSQAVEKAKAEKKYIIVDVYADWCGWCKKMDASTFKDDAVSDFVNSNMVALKLNSEVGDGAEFAQKYKITGLPTIVYLDSKGNLVRVAPGYKNATQLLKEIEAFKIKRKNISMSEYLDVRKDFISLTKNELADDDSGLMFKALTMGEENKTFEFDELKASIKVANPVTLSQMDVFNLIGREKYDQAQKKIQSENLASSFSKKQSIFLTLTLIEFGDDSIEVLQMINEHSIKTKDLDVLETKAAAQYFLGDMEDAKKTIHAHNKIQKKKKVSPSPSMEVLKTIIFQS